LLATLMASGSPWAAANARQGASRWRITWPASV
jgi:hypothetical protein